MLIIKHNLGSKSKQRVKEVTHTHTYPTHLQSVLLLQHGCVSRGKGCLTKWCFPRWAQLPVCRVCVGFLWCAYAQTSLCVCLCMSICVCIRIIHMLFLEDSGLLQLGRHESKSNSHSCPKTSQWWRTVCRTAESQTASWCFSYYYHLE